MKTILILLFTVAGTAAVCLSLLKEREMKKARNYPGNIWKWNRKTSEFDSFEALKHNGSTICSVDYIDDLNGVEIIVSGEDVYPYLSVLPSGNLTGFIGDIWTTLGEALKFRTVFRKLGQPAGDTLVRGEIHSILSATTMQTYTTGYYSYSHQIGTTYYGLFILSEGTRVSRWWYTSIFSPGLWTMSLSFVVGITGLLFVMYRMKRAFCHNYIECNDELAIPSYNFLNILGVLTGQGFQNIPTCWSLRMLIISAVIMGMLISCGFSSTLTSYLAITGNFLPLNSLEDIASERSHSLCVRVDGGAHVMLEKFLRTKNIVPDSAEWKNLVNKNCPDMSDPRDVSAKICKSGFVFLEAVDVFLSIYRPVQHRCHMAQIQDIYWNPNLVFLHGRSSAYRRVIDKYIMRLRTAGILNYLERKWISREFPSSNDHQWGFKPVESTHVVLLLTALLIMILVSAIMCILENIWFRLQQRILTKKRDKRVNHFPKAPFDFPANELDSASKRVWAINA